VIAASLALVAATSACERRDEPRDSHTEILRSRLTGVWDATFTLERTPRGVVTAGTTAAPRSVAGELALLASPHGQTDPWLRERATHIGVYAADFTPLGIPLQQAGPVPAVTAAIVAPDSVIAILPSGAVDGSLVLRGVLVGRNTVRGSWSFEARSAGGWGGAFTLERR
jgi:hypothetical protein